MLTYLLGRIFVYMIKKNKQVNRYIKRYEKKFNSPSPVISFDDGVEQQRMQEILPIIHKDGNFPQHSHFTKYRSGQRR